MITRRELDEGAVAYKGPYIRTVEHRLFRLLEEDYGFPKATCRSLVHLLWEAAEEVYTDKLPEGQIVYVAVDAGEKAGKPIASLKTRSVRLTIHHRADVEVLSQEGLQAMRRRRVLRLSQEARDQGALLTQEDLAMLLCVTTRTIKRDIKELKAQGHVVPTRGTVQDIGPGVSHKTRIVELWLQGHEYTDLERMTGHSTGSIQRYLTGFARVARFQEQGYTLHEISNLTELSPKVVQEYVDLYHEHQDKPEAKERLDQVLSVPRPTRGGKTGLHRQKGGVGES